MIDELELDAEHAEAIVEAGIEFEVHTEDMPDSDADKIEAAHDIVAMAIDSWVDDEVRPDSDDKQVAEAGEQIKQILDIAGIEIDDDGGIEYGELPQLVDDEGDGDTSDDGDGDGDGETPFDINDIIDNYDDLKVGDVVEAMQGLDDDDIEAVKEYEKEEGRKRKAILNFEPEDEPVDGDAEEEGEGVDLDALERKELIAFAKENDVKLAPRGKSDDEIRAIIAEALGGEDDTSDDDGDGDGDGDDGEPWEGYDELAVKDIKEGLTDAANDEDEPLTVEQAETVVAYEEANKNRPSLVKWLKALRDEIAEAGDGDGDGDEPADDGEAGEAVDEAVAKDDRKDGRKAKAGKFVLTREMVLEALSEGEVRIDIG